MSSFEMYLLFLVLPKIGAVLWWGGILIAILSIICCFGVSGELSQKEREKEYKPLIRQALIASLVAVLSLFIPSQKDMAIIYLAPKIINNQSIQQLPAEVLKFIDKEISKDE